MIRTHRLSTTAILIVCVMGTASSEILLANDDATASRSGFASPSADTITTAKKDVSAISTTAAFGGEQLPGTTEFVRSVLKHPPLTLDNHASGTFTVRPDESTIFAQRGGRGRGFRGRRNNGAAAAIFLGAAAAIVGTAVLVYANRPECGATPGAGGCGYGTKVAGGAVLSGGLVGLAVGALTWR